MNILVLTQQSGILRPFAVILGVIMDYIYRFLEMLGIPNVSLTIILLTVVVNIILIPITIKQQKFSRMSAIITPEIQKIQAKYKNKKDEASARMMQAETSAVYDKYGASPMGGCLPSLIQLPILFALYRVIYNIPAYVEPIREIYEKIATPIMAADSDGSIMTNLISDLSLRITNFDITNINKIIDALALVKTSGWTSISDAFAAHTDVVQAITQYAPEISKINWLPGGLSVSDAPIVLSRGISGIFPGVLIPILAAASQWLNIQIMQSMQPAPASNNDDNQMASQMKMMNNMMPLMSLFFCATLPAGIGVYWISSAVIRTVITFIINKSLKRVDVEQIVEANKEKAAKKAEKRGERQKQIDQYASMNTRDISKRSISSIAGGSVNHDEIKSSGNNSDKSGKSNASAGSADTGKKSSSGSKGKNSKSDGSGSISDIANMLKRRD